MVGKSAVQFMFWLSLCSSTFGYLEVPQYLQNTFKNSAYANKFRITMISYRQKSLHQNSESKPIYTGMNPKTSIDFWLLGRTKWEFTVMQSVLEEFFLSHSCNGGYNAKFYLSKLCVCVLFLGNKDFWYWNTAKLSSEKWEKVMDRFFFF